MPVSYFLGVKIYLLLAVIYVVLAIHSFISSINGTKINVTSLSLLLVSLSILYSVITSIFQTGLLNSLSAVALYLLYVLPLLLFVASGELIDKINFEFAFKLNVFLAIIVGLVAIYQLRYDPLVLGLYADSSYADFQYWSVKRAASFMGSIQVFGAYMSFSLLAIYAFPPFEKRINALISIAIYFLGLLSGSQLFFFISSIILISIMVNSLRIIDFFLVGVLFLFSILFLDIELPKFDSFDRLFSIFEQGSSHIDKLNEGRINIWLSTIENTPILSGNGLGTASLVVSGSGRYNAESYFLNIYYEGGIFLLTGFLFMFFYFIHRSKFDNKWMLYFVYFSYGMSVHVFFSVALFLPWLILLRINQDIKR